jgi:hypothetical protein
MATYAVDITKKLMKTVIMTVPDSVSKEDAQEWVDDNIDDVFDVERYQGEVKWNVDDLSEGESLEVNISEKLADEEYEIEGFYPWPK